MPEHLSSLAVSVNRLKSYVAAVTIMTGLLFAGPEVRAAAMQGDAPDHGAKQKFSEFAYVVNTIYGDDFSGYRMNIFTGELTPLPGSPFAPGPYYHEYGAINDLAIDTKHGFLYSTTAGYGSLILGFSIAADGVLTPLPSAAAGCGGTPMNVTVDPSDRFVYCSGVQTGIAGYSINPATGLLSAVPGSPVDSGLIVGKVVIDPSARFAYATQPLGPGLLGFTINRATGALTPISGSPFTGNFDRVIIDTTGRFLYAFAGIGGVEINEYIINQRTGALTLSPRSPFSGPVGVAGAVVDPTGRFLYVLDSQVEDSAGSNQVAGFSIDPFTGGLTPLPSSPLALGFSPSSLAVDPTGRFVYVLDEGGNTVSGYAINSRTGALKPLPGPPVPTGSGPTGIVVGAFIGR